LLKISFSQVAAPGESAHQVEKEGPFKFEFLMKSLSLCSLIFSLEELRDHL